MANGEDEDDCVRGWVDRREQGWGMGLLLNGWWR